MKKLQLISIFLVFISNFSFSQTKSEIDYLLDEIGKIDDSKTISNTKSGIKLIEYGREILPTLTKFFSDQNLTNVNSECNQQKLKKGEIAIIIADRIEGMPYYKLTQIQNCNLTFCENNLNLIEYYLPYIEQKGLIEFQKRYKEWLVSDERINYISSIDKE